VVLTTQSTNHLFIVVLGRFESEQSTDQKCLGRPDEGGDKMSEEIGIYGPILEMLCERITEKHEQYGTSYLNRDYEWLHRRMMIEVGELDAELFSPHLSGENTIKECLDVAICALLIADKRRREERPVWVLMAFEDPAPF
jgi:hypothetical protein